MFKVGLKRKEKQGDFEAVPELPKHLEHTRRITILGRVNVFGFVVGGMHKR